MAIALDANLLVTDLNTGGITPITVNTTSAAAANTKVVVLISFFEGTANLITAMTIGGTAAALDKRNSNGSDRFDIWSADKAAGMASASAITMTMAGNTGGGMLIGVHSFTGLATSGSVVTTSSATSTATAWSSGSATNTGFANALYIGGSGNEDGTNPTTSTATSGTEIHDRYRAADGQGFATGYKIVSTVASDSIAGNWSNAASTANTGALVIYAGDTQPASVITITAGSGVGVDTDFVGTAHRQVMQWGPAPTSAVTSVASAASDTSLLAANARRIGASVYNDSLEEMFVKYGTGASSSSFTVNLSSGGYWTMPQPIYTGALNGIWANANGFARVTEMTF
jgi:hypothetical protein